MIGLLPHETELTGRWEETGDRVRADATCERIASLTNGVLDPVQDHPKFDGWVRLYRDQSDGRYWERSYSESGLHGGGPPTLRWASDEEVASHYGFRP
jgi:hypothetical protein